MKCLLYHTINILLYCIRSHIKTPLLLIEHNLNVILIPFHNERHERYIIYGLITTIDVTRNDAHSLLSRLHSHSSTMQSIREKEVSKMSTYNLSTLFSRTNDTYILKRLLPSTTMLVPKYGDRVPSQLFSHN